MKSKSQSKHELAQKVIKILIDSGLSINQQIIIIKQVKERLDFCKKIGEEMRQQKFEF